MPIFKGSKSDLDKSILELEHALECAKKKREELQRATEVERVAVDKAIQAAAQAVQLLKRS